MKVRKESVSVKYIKETQEYLFLQLYVEDVEEEAGECWRQLKLKVPKKWFEKIK